MLKGLSVFQLDRAGNSSRNQVYFTWCWRVSILIKTTEGKDIAFLFNFNSFYYKRTLIGFPVGWPLPDNIKGAQERNQR